MTAIGPERIYLSQASGGAADGPRGAQKPETTEKRRTVHTFSHDKITDPETGLTFIRLFYKDRMNPGRNIQIAVAPEHGSNLVQFNVGGREVFYTDKQALREDRWTGCFVLWPLPNRYDRGGRKQYSFEGQEVSLEDIHRKEGNRPLIHGLVDDQVWEADEPVVTKDGVSFKTHIAITKDSRLFAHFPYESELTLQYIVGRDGVEVIYTAENRDSRNMPSVFALHPYYALLGGREGTRVRIPGLSVMESTADLLPTGKLKDVQGTEYDIREPRPVKGMWFDDVWTNLVTGQYPYVEYPELGLRINQITTTDFTHTVLYTQPEAESGFICLEPQTGSTNAINLADIARREGDEELAKAAHLIVVPPGKSHSGKVRFALEFMDK